MASHASVDSRAWLMGREPLDAAVRRLVLVLVGGGGGGGGQRSARVLDAIKNHVLPTQPEVALAFTCTAALVLPTQGVAAAQLPDMVANLCEGAPQAGTPGHPYALASMANLLRARPDLWPSNLSMAWVKRAWDAVRSTRVYHDLDGAARLLKVHLGLLTSFEPSNEERQAHDALLDECEGVLEGIVRLLKRAPEHQVGRIALLESLLPLLTSDRASRLLLKVAQIAKQVAESVRDALQLQEPPSTQLNTAMTTFPVFRELCGTKGGALVDVTCRTALAQVLEAVIEWDISRLPIGDSEELLSSALAFLRTSLLASEPEANVRQGVLQLIQSWSCVAVAGDSPLGGLIREVCNVLRVGAPYFVDGPYAFLVFERVANACRRLDVGMQAVLHTMQELSVSDEAAGNGVRQRLMEEISGLHRSCSMELLLAASRLHACYTGKSILSAEQLGFLWLWSKRSNVGDWLSDENISDDTPMEEEDVDYANDLEHVAAVLGARGY